jgi:hypothetical protein
MIRRSWRGAARGPQWRLQARDTTRGLGAPLARIVAAATS